MSQRVAIPIYSQRTSPQGALASPGKAVDVAASASALEAEASGVRLANDLGRSLGLLAQIETGQEESRQESLYADVRAEAMKRTIGLREELADDTDYGTHKERFASGIEGINKYAREALNGRDHLVNRFNREYGLYAANQDFEVRRIAVKGINDQQVAGLSKRIGESRVGYSLNAANNEIISSGLIQEADRLEKTGAISAQVAQKVRDNIQNEKSNTVASLSTLKNPKAAEQSFGKRLGIAASPGGIADPADFAAQFESGQQGGRAIGYDSTGGTSYGKFQIASKPGTFDEWLSWLDKNGHQDAAAALRVSGPADTGSKNGTMPETWKRLVDQGVITDDMQKQFIRETHVMPVLAGVPPEVRAAMENNPALAAALFSTATQHRSGAKKLLTTAWHQSGGDISLFVRSLYAARKGQFGSSTEEVRKSVHERLDTEEGMLQTALRGEGAQSADPVLADAIAGMSVNEVMQHYTEAQGLLRKQEVERHQSAALYLKNKDDFIKYGVETGDWTMADQTAKKLDSLGQTEAAQEMVRAKEIYQLAQPFMRSVHNAAFEDQEAALDSTFTSIMRAAPQDTGIILHVRGAAAKALQQRKELFLKDPATTARAVTREQALFQDMPASPPSPEVEARQNMSIQRWLGRGIPGFAERVLTNQEATDMKSLISDVNTPTEKKLAALVGMAAGYGDLWARVVQENEIPAGISAAIKFFADNHNDSSGIARDLLAASLLPDNKVPKTDLTEADIQAAFAKNDYMKFNDALMRAFPRHPAFAIANTETQHAAAKLARINGLSRLGGLSSPYIFVTSDNMLLRLPRDGGLDTDQVVSGLNAIRNDIRQYVPNIDDADAHSVRNAGIWRNSGTDAELIADGKLVLKIPLAQSVERYTQDRVELNQKLPLLGGANNNTSALTFSMPELYAETPEQAQRRGEERLRIGGRYFNPDYQLQ